MQHSHTSKVHVQGTQGCNHVHFGKIFHALILYPVIIVNTPQIFVTLCFETVIVAHKRCSSTHACGCLTDHQTILNPLHLNADILTKLGPAMGPMEVLHSDNSQTVFSETGDVAQWLEGRNSKPKTLGSIPRRGRVRNSFSVPPGQLSLEDA